MGWRSWRSGGRPPRCRRGRTLCQNASASGSRSSPRRRWGRASGCPDRSWPGPRGMERWSRTGRGSCRASRSRLSLVDLDAAQDVRAGTEEEVGPGVDAGVGEGGRKGPALQALRASGRGSRRSHPRAVPRRADAWVIRSTSGLRPSTEEIEAVAPRSAVSSSGAILLRLFRRFDEGVELRSP